MEKIRKIKADLSEMHNAKVYELQECLGNFMIANKYVSWWKNFSLEN